MLEPTTVVRHEELSFIEPLTAEHIENIVAAFIRGVADHLAEKGCTLIGHIKCLIDAGGDDCLFVSLTRFATAPRAKGKLPRATRTARMELNVIVFGVTQEVAEDAVEAEFVAQFRGPGGQPPERTGKG
jgi:hypothetical protein